MKIRIFHNLYFWIQIHSFLVFVIIYNLWVLHMIGDFDLDLGWWQWWFVFDFVWFCVKH